jgi:WD40 repeat protein/serine/threonine protein kinase
MSGCPSQERLMQLLRGELAKAEYAAVETHVETCADCQEALERLGEGPEEGEWRQRVPEPPAPLPEITLPPPTAPGFIGRVAEFDIIRELGTDGAMGTVYEADDTALGRKVAIKAIKPELAVSPGLRDRFAREARAAAAVKSDYVVPIHKVEPRADGFELPFLVMELIDGESLKQYQLKQYQERRGLLPPHETATIAREIALGLAAIHAHGLVHRDIKPSNIMLDRRRAGQARITDFGLARPTAASEDRLTRSGGTPGTPAYMSPEQVAAPGEVDARSDQFSLGVVLYELLTGGLPFRGATPLETWEQVKTGEPVAPTRLVPKLPRDVETICLKCLEKEPGRRYEGAAELAEDLGRFLAGEPVRARPVSTFERGWRWSRRNPVVAGLAALLTVTIVLGTGGISRGFLAARAAESLAKEIAKKEVTARKQAEKAQEDEKTARELTEVRLYFNLIALAHREWTTNKIAHANALLDQCPPSLRHWEWYHLKRLFQGSRLTLRAHKGSVNKVAFSPNGTLMASAGEDGTVVLYEPATGRVLKTLRGHARTRLREAPVPSPVDVLPVLGPRREAVSDAVTSLAFSPDSRRLVSASKDETAIVWDLSTFQPAVRLEGHTSAVLDVKYSPDGTRICSAGDDATLRVWDTVDGRLIRTISLGDVSLECLAFHPGGRRIATAGGDSMSVKEWDVDSGSAVREFSISPINVKDLAYRPDGKQLALVGTNFPVVVWETETAQSFRMPTGPEGTALAVAFSADGERLIVGGVDRTLTVWTGADSKDGRRFKGHVDAVRSVAFSPDGRQIASASDDGTVKVWSESNGSESASFWQHEGEVTDVAFSPDGRRVASAGYDRAIKLWDTVSGREERALHAYDGTVYGLAFRPDGRRLASASDDMLARVWDPRTGQCLLTLKGHTAPVNAVAFSPDGRRLATAGDDHFVRIWDAESGRQIRMLSGHQDRVTGVAYDPEGKWLASSGGDAIVKLWDAVSGDLARDLKGHVDTVWRVAFSPDGRRLATAGWDHTIRLWDPESGRELFKLVGHDKDVAGLAFSPDGRRLLSTGGDGSVKVWEPNSGQEIITLRPAGDHKMFAVSFSSDQQRVALGFDQKVQVWFGLPESEPVAQPQEPRWSVRERASLTGHAQAVHSVAFAPDGRTLATGSQDETIKLWDLPAVKERLTLRGHQAVVRAVVFIDEGRSLASAGFDGRIKLWDPADGREIKTIPAHQEKIYALAASPDGLTVASAPVIALNQQGESPCRGALATRNRR